MGDLLHQVDQVDNRIHALHLHHYHILLLELFYCSWNHLIYG